MKGKKMMKFVLGFVLSVGMAFIPLMASASEVIKIGKIDPLSGTFGTAGDMSGNHYVQMAEYINAKGGPLGKKLEIVKFDNKNNAAESVFQLKRAIDQGIRIIGQGHSSGVTAALSDAIVKHNERNPDKRVIFLVPDCTDPSLTEIDKCNFWFFRWGSTADQKVAALVRSLADDKSLKKVFLINMDYSHGHGTSAASREWLKKVRPDIEIVGDIFHPVGKIKDFSPYVSNIKASGAGAVITGDWGEDLNMLIKAYNSAGLKGRLATFYVGAIGAPSALREAGVGTLQVTTWHINYNEGNNRFTNEFALHYKKRFGSAHDFYYSDVIPMLEMLCSAIEKTKSVDPLNIAFALEGMKVNIPTGECEMRADNHQAVMPQIVSVFSKKGNGVKYDAENTGFGWKTVNVVPANDLYFPTTCNMKRPSK